jgi:predicted PurR-regulated permease PerM
LVVAFWLLMDLPSIGAECTRLLGTKHEEDIHFLHITFSRVMDGYIKGTLLQCALIALGCIIAFSILGVPNAIALGIITGLLNIIPVIGPWFGGAAAALAALFVSPFVALLALIITIAIQQFVYTFISPKIMANSVDVHPVLVVFAMMIGYAIGMTMSGLVGSLVGMLLSIPAAAVGKAIFVYYFEKHTGRHLIAEDGVFFKGVPSAGDAPNPEADATSPHPQMLAARIKAEAREAARKAEGAATRMRGHSGHEHEDAPPAAKKK